LSKELLPDLRLTILKPTGTDLNQTSSFIFGAKGGANPKAKNQSLHKFRKINISVG